MTASQITGILLAGGKSSRMGTDKGLLLIGKETFIERSIAVLEVVTNEVIIVANNPEYNKFGKKVVNDLVTEIGPAGGILSGLEASKTECNFVLACDMPLFSIEAFRYISDHYDENRITISSLDGLLNPLAGFYPKRFSSGLLKMINEGERKLQDMIMKFGTNVVPIDAFPSIHPSFININNKEELMKYANENTGIWNT